MLPVFRAAAQSPDTRICNCLSTALDANFMDAMKARFGSTAVLVHREEELHPAQSQAVNFEIPSMTPKAGCGAVYKILIRDKNGAVVYEEEDSQPKFAYTFEQCDSRYDVTVVASVKSPGGGDGNCSRNRHFYVRPVCNTNTCACDPPADPRNPGTSRNVGLDAKLTCVLTTATRRSYSFNYKITNKTSCRMVVDSVTVLGETITGRAPALPAGAFTPKYTIAVSTPLSTPVPKFGSLNVVVYYRVNDRSCKATLKVPYTDCR